MSETSWGASGPSGSTGGKAERVALIAVIVGGLLLVTTFFFLWQGAKRDATAAQGEMERLKIATHNAEFDAKRAEASLAAYRRKLGNTQGALALKREQLGYFTTCVSGADAAYAAVQAGNTTEANQIMADANAACQKAKALI